MRVLLALLAVLLVVVPIGGRSLAHIRVESEVGLLEDDGLPGHTTRLERFVACTHGSDANPGTATKPFKSLRAARDSVRHARQHVANISSATIWIYAGTCFSWQLVPGQQSAPLELGLQDSHVAWRAVAGRVSFSGGVPLKASAASSLSEHDSLLFAKDVRAQIRVVDLAHVSDLGQLRPLSWSSGDAIIRADRYVPAAVEMLFVGPSDSASMTMRARYPNRHATPSTTDWMEISNASNAELSATVAVSAARRQSWAKQLASSGELWAHGLWTFNWADSHRAIGSVDSAEPELGARLAFRGLQPCGMPLDTESNISDAKAGQQGGHMYVYNGMIDIDRPGEYAIDFIKQKLYYLPHAAAGTYELTVASELVRVDGAENISFSGIDFRGARGAGIVIVNSTSVTVSNGSVTDVGLTAVNVTGGSNCGLSRMELTRAGTGGVILDGGDRQTLTPSRHFVHSCRIHNVNRRVMNYAPSVAMAGVGQEVRGAELYDAPQQAVYVQGNSHKLLDSSIHDVIQECNDCGAFYFGRDFTYRGMVISGCNFTIPGTIWWNISDTVVASVVYADDFASSVHVLHNHFVVGSSVNIVFMLNGGRDHHFIGNVVKPLNDRETRAVQVARPGHCELNLVIYNHGCPGNASTFALGATAEPICDLCLGWGHGAIQRELGHVPFNTSEAWIDAFPALAHITADRMCEARGNVIRDNVHCMPDSLIKMIPSLHQGLNLSNFGSVEHNNSWDVAVCGGPAPPAQGVAYCDH